MSAPTIIPVSGSDAYDGSAPDGEESATPATPAAETTPSTTPSTTSGQDAKEAKPRVYPEVGAALLKARRESGMTQQQLADATGVSRITIQRIEQAHINPSFKTLEALAHGMGRTLTISFDEHRG